MFRLDEHFLQSGYTIHKGGLKRLNLPDCCREELYETEFGVKYLNNDGQIIILPTAKCRKCGKLYFVNRSRYCLIVNKLKYEFVKL